MTEQMNAADYRKNKRRKLATYDSRESEIVTSILEYLWAVGVVAARTQAGEVKLEDGSYMHLAPEGWPDITGHAMTARGTVPLYIEVKTRIGRLRPLQEAFQARANADGCLHIVARSIDDVRADFRANGVQTREAI